MAGIGMPTQTPETLLTMTNLKHDHLDANPVEWKTYLLNSEEYRDWLLAQYRPVLDFIEQFLPDYYTNQRIAETDRLWRYIGDEGMDEEDEELYKEQFPDKKKALEELIEVESEVLKECVGVFYKNYFNNKINNAEN